MKVIKKGMVVENEKGDLSFTGWTFDGEGGAINIDEIVEIVKEELEKCQED